MNDAARHTLLDAALLRPDHPRIHTPTTRELNVIRCLSHGLDEELAGEVLGLSVHSVRTTAGHARVKLAAKNNAHAVARALRHGLIA